MPLRRPRTCGPVRPNALSARRDSPSDSAMATASSAEAAARVGTAGTPHFSTRRAAGPGPASRLAHFGPMSMPRSRGRRPRRTTPRRPWRLDGAVDATRVRADMGHCCSRPLGEGSCATATPWEVSGAAASAGADPRMQATIGFFEDCATRPTTSRAACAGSAMSSVVTTMTTSTASSPRTSSSASPRTEAVPSAVRSTGFPTAAVGSRPLAARPEWPDRALGRRGHPPRTHPLRG